MSKYIEERDWENLQKAFFEGVGEYGIPQIEPIYDINVDNWIGFNYARGCENPELHGVHFFLDDYQFKRVWMQPDTYVKMLSRFQAVCSPDFSPYSDFPKALQIWNHYRKHWCAAYWQLHGIKVIPTITWSDPSTYEWCFDGEPVGGVVAISAVGVLKTKEGRKIHVEGCEVMMERLRPTKILYRGAIPEELDQSIKDIIVKIPNFSDKFDELHKKKKEQAQWLKANQD